MLEIDAFIQGHVRRGWREGSYFIPIDCTHPLQNVTIDLDRVTHWRARNSIVVIRDAQFQYCGNPYVTDFSFLGSVVGELFGSGLF